MNSYHHPRKFKSRDSGCCSVNFLKCLLYVFNIVFLMSGCAVLGVGVWTMLAKHQYIYLLYTSTYAAAAYILIAAGALVILVTLLGCVSISREARFSLLMFTFLLLVIFLLEAVGGVLAYVYQEQVHGELSAHLQDTFTHSYSFSKDITKAVDDLQSTFRCCGAKFYSDWDHSRWRLQSPQVNNSVPDSCCKSIKPYCGVRSHPSNIHYSGCIHQLDYFVREHLIVLGAVGLGLSLVQVFGLIFSTCLYVKLKDVDDSDIY